MVSAYSAVSHAVIQEGKECSRASLLYNRPGWWLFVVPSPSRCPAAVGARRFMHHASCIHTQSFSWHPRKCDICVSVCSFYELSLARASLIVIRCDQLSFFVCTVDYLHKGTKDRDHYAFALCPPSSRSFRFFGTWYSSSRVCAESDLQFAAAM
jgi:hypothetical protein